MTGQNNNSLTRKQKMPHGHGHSHGGSGGCGHGASGLNGEEFGLQYSLYQKIDIENVTCLNEEIDDSGKTVFKPWEDRKNREKVRIILLICFVFRSKIWFQVRETEGLYSSP